MNKGHDKGHKRQMSDREVMKLAFEYIYDCDNKDPLVETLRQALERPQTPDDLLRQSEREWVSLTDDEEIELDEKYGDDFNAYIEARDALLKEKNT